jgi:hypothetical protein
MSDAITLPLADYKRLLEAAESDDTLDWCEVCGAWLDIEDPARCTAEDFRGCWKVATRRKQDEHLCRSYRGLKLDERP